MGCVIKCPETKRNNVMQYSRIYSRALCLLICVSMMMFVPQKGRAEQGKRKKVALVLSGGGAKGADRKSVV